MERTILIGCAGASCSGKSTLTEWLARILDLAVIHQDKFFKADSQVPVVDGVQHWDCPDALNMDAFASHLRNIKSSTVRVGSELSPNRPTISNDDIQQSELDSLTAQSSDFREKYGLNGSSATKIYLVDGFLMMDSDPVLQALDFIIFLHSDYLVLKQRRESRFSYVTLEGTWQDPPNYFSQFVFPAYEQFNSRILAKLEPTESFQTVAISNGCDTIDVFAINSGIAGISEMVSRAVEVVLANVEAEMQSMFVDSASKCLDSDMLLGITEVDSVSGIVSAV
ncbi:hypothetical protein BDR26DRAFT_914718 [Obelidium mucronatum]|nr:hypothetical protein BDR26DRAFT_914718 [Obelidium mucronatum]